jgi:putative hemolysin
MEEDQSLRIDVDAVLEAKNPKLARRLPRFVKSYLKRIVHQDTINKFLEESKGKQGIEFVEATIKFLDLKVEIEGFENLPDSGRYIFAANHPLGGLESLVLMSTVNKKFKDFKFVVNDILMFLKPLAVLFLPINKHGSQSRESLTLINEYYASDYQILYFPAGLVSRKIKGKVQDLAWQKSFVNKAVEFKRDIVPIFIEGRNSNFFYNLSRFRKFLGIKANIEMLYLADEMMKQRGKTIKIVFGEVFPYTNIDKSKNTTEWAAYFRNLVYSLQKSKNNQKK